MKESNIQSLMMMGDVRDFKAFLPLLTELGLDKYDSLNFSKFDMEASLNELKSKWKTLDVEKIQYLMKYAIVHEVMKVEERKAIRREMKDKTPPLSPKKLNKKSRTSKAGSRSKSGNLTKQVEDIIQAKSIPQSMNDDVSTIKNADPSSEKKPLKSKTVKKAKKNKAVTEQDKAAEKESAQNTMRHEAEVKRLEEKTREQLEKMLKKLTKQINDQNE